MRCSIVYSSKTGNTKMLADTIKDTLKDDCIYFGEPSDKALDSEKIYVGFWTDKGSCPEDISDSLKSIHNKEFFLFGTAGFGESQGYFNRVIEKAKDNISDDCKVVGSYMCQGKMPMSVRERYEKMLE